MAGTSVSTRRAPSRRFENYVFTRLVGAGAGLTEIDDKQFRRLTSADEIVDEDATFVIVQIGFGFQLDGITYNKIAIDPNGWAALVDPASGTFLSGECLAGTTNDNTNILGTFSSDAVLLAPWFDNLRNVFSDPSHLVTAPFNYSFEKIERISLGIEPPTPFFNPVAYGTSCYNDNRSKKGRRFIVRWSVITNPTGITVSHLKFELVLYENGTIEFRYAPKNVPGLIPASYEEESATCGIFMPNGTNRFRDFALGLGYQDDRRQEYVYGGAAYDSSFTDDGVDPQNDGATNVSYVHNLWASLNWPARHDVGCTMTFAPPVNRRRVLPRKQVRHLDNHERMPIVYRSGIGAASIAAGSTFDDRKSPSYTTSSNGTIVNYPTTLTRFFGGSGPGTAERQDLFAGDFLVTGSVVKSAIEQFVIVNDESSIEPFQEIGQKDQGEDASTSEYFLSGTREDLYGGFTQGLRSKMQVRFSLPIDYNVQMPGSTSSIYYYNSRARSWNVPINSTYVLESGSSVPPAASTKGDWSNPREGWALGATGQNPFPINEDSRGFGPWGNIVSSGSNNPTAVNDQTDPDIMDPLNYDSKTIVKALGKSYAKSTRNNPEYQPVPDETFRIPITKPFLVEKAIIDLPMSAGPGWFDDRTQLFETSDGDNSGAATGGVQQGGPAITVALFKRTQLGKTTYGANGPHAPSQLDLILTGTIIPSGDDINQLTLRVRDSFAGQYLLTPIGFRSAGHPASAVVQSNGSSYFTGSVSLKTQPLSSVGVVLLHHGSADLTVMRNFGFGSFGPLVRNLAQNYQTLSLSSPGQPIETGGSSVSLRTLAVAPFGRAGTGLVPSGRSALGRELSTLQGKFDPSGQSMPNPYYVGPNALSADIDATINYWEDELDAAAYNVNVSSLAPISLLSHSPCPYLLMPGDELVLSISKMHPFIAQGKNIPGEWFSGSIAPHDVGLITGSVNITLYGSQLQEGKAQIEPPSLNLGSGVSYEVIGNDPICDVHDAPYQAELSGSSSDRFNVERAVDYIFIGQSQTLYGANPAVSSSFDTQTYYSSTDASVRDRSWSDQQNWTRDRRLFELQKTNVNRKLICDEELLWDSRIPDPSSMLSIQSPGLTLAAGDTTGGTVGPASINLALITGREYGELTDYVGSPPASGSRGMGDWIMSFPFEPRWSRVSHTFADVLRGSNFRWREAGGGLRSSRYVLYSNMSIEYGKIVGGIRTINAETTEQTSGISQGVGQPEFIKFMYGFGDGRNSKDDNCHVTHRRTDLNYATVAGAEVRGWRHGMISGFPLRTSAIFRRNSFGQMRDMLEQRLDTRFFITSSVGANIGSSPVNVRFVDSTGTVTLPEYTYSSNLSFESTSSLPYFDGQVRNREEPIAYARTNQSIVII